MGTALLLVRYDTVAPAAVYGVLGGRLPTNLDPITVDFNFSKAGLGGTSYGHSSSVPKSIRRIVAAA
jgi:hypothetical protein